MQAWTLLLVSIVSFVGLLRGHYAVATIAPATFWPGLWLALLAPGTTVYATDRLRELGFPINLALAATWLALTALGYRLATRPATTAPGGAAGPARAGALP